MTSDLMINEKGRREWEAMLLAAPLATQPGLHYDFCGLQAHKKLKHAHVYC